MRVGLPFSVYSVLVKYREPIKQQCVICCEMAGYNYHFPSRSSALMQEFRLTVFFIDVIKV